MRFRFWYIFLKDSRIIYYPGILDMKLAALISGGKDSILALERMHNEGNKIEYLLSMNPKSRESYMFHHPNIWITDLISETMGVPLIKGETHGRKEDELQDLKGLIERVANNIDGIITGALASTYQKTRIENICKEFDIKSYSPLWGIDPMDMWVELLDKNYKVMITSVAAQGLEKKWLGKIIGSEELADLEDLSDKYRFHLAFEGGEAETLVLNMPLYFKGIKILRSEIQWENSSGVYNILEAALEE